MANRLKSALRAALKIYRRTIYVLSGKRTKTSRAMDIDNYEEWYYSRPQAKKYLNNNKIWMNLVDMIQYFKPNRVFEFGSGLGNVLKECQDRDIDIVGSETSE